MLVATALHTNHPPDDLMDARGLENTNCHNFETLHLTSDPVYWAWDLTIDA